MRAHKVRDAHASLSLMTLQRHVEVKFLFQRLICSCVPFGEPVVVVQDTERGYTQGPNSVNGNCTVFKVLSSDQKSTAFVRSVGLAS